MKDRKTYAIDLSESELYSIKECLSDLRKRIVSDYQSSFGAQNIEPMSNPLFIAACKLQMKLAQVENPNRAVTLQDFLNYGKK